ncbi:immunoglobulin superfamily member 3-like [Sinocyclocheilus grahami]|uniref:immunoglobulin superfamily member 3-like n=1 Tax=Sinocyclocheilus grahami TaxID=75366 RepID=UPI0007AC5CDC|nr:PREDICTED: immunoglobulin superfamily member 3-like [Sinocyclocheilus grahami]
MDKNTGRDLCSGQIQVQIQEGPLYRVKGYPISISCNVTGFTGPSNRDFQFILKKPNVELNMISTSDPEFAYGMFSGRIRNKEMYIQRLSGSSVLLTINNLLENDAGDLLCETLHTGGAYYGDYAAETKLNVIADTLEASYSGSPSQSLSEGDPLQLECQVSSQTFQHTHLSVTWFLHGEEDEIPRPIITLDKDLTVKPGAGFEDGYRAGLISMDKVEDTTYRLKMPQVQQSDQGKFFCKAIEWIQDPDRSWTQIAHKTTTACNVEIKRIDQRNYQLSIQQPSDTHFILMVPRASKQQEGQYQCQVDAYQKDVQKALKNSNPLAVIVHKPEIKLHVQKENRTFNITNHQTAFTIDCVIDSQSSDKSVFEVTWFKVQEEEGPVTIFTARRDGTLHSAISDKNLLFGRPLATHYKLTVPQINPTDMGQYYCQVEEWLLTANTWKKFASDKSGELSIYVHTEGDSEKQIDPLGITLAIAIPLICFLVLVILLLLRKGHKKKPELKKKKDCLWAEKNGLTLVPSCD